MVGPADLLTSFAELAQVISGRTHNDSVIRDYAEVIQDVATGVSEGSIVFAPGDDWLNLVVNAGGALVGSPLQVAGGGELKPVGALLGPLGSATAAREAMSELALRLDPLCSLVVARTIPGDRAALSRAWYDKAIVCTIAGDFDGARVCLTKAIEIDRMARNRAAKSMGLKDIFSSRRWSSRDCLWIIFSPAVIGGAYLLTLLSTWLWILSGPIMLVATFLLLVTLAVRRRFCPDCGKADPVLLFWTQSTCERCGRRFSA